MLCTRMTSLVFLLLELLPFLCLNLISCPLCNSNTHHNILMILFRNVEQDETMCVPNLLLESQHLLLLFFFFFFFFFF